jgi:hypothetical protein
MTEAQDSLFMAFRDLVGGAFGGLLAGVALRGAPTKLTWLLGLVLFTLLAGGYWFDQKAKQAVADISSPLELFSDEEGGQAESDRQRVKWPPHRAS